MSSLSERERASVEEYLPMIRREVFYRGGKDGEYLGVACVGFVQAMRTFDPKKGRSFETHVLARMVGAIADAKRELIGKKGAYLRKSLDNLPLDGLEGLVISEENDLERVEHEEEIARLLSKIPTRYAYILREHYLQGRTLKEVGKRLGVCEERAWQLKREALLKCRRK